MKLLYILFATLLLSLACYAQAPDTGFPPYGSFENGNLAAINRGNLNVNIDIPIISQAGRGLNFTFSITQDSLLWQIVNGAWVSVVDQSGNPTFGWNLGNITGSILYTTWTAGGSCPGQYWQSYRYLDPRGTVHSFPSVYKRTISCNPGSATTGYASDGSGYYIDISSSPEQPVVRSPSGLQFTKDGTIKGTNGNYISKIVNGNETDWVDTTGNIILKVIRAADNSNITYQYFKEDGTYNAVTVSLYQLGIRSNFHCTGIQDYWGPAAYVPINVTLPNTKQFQIWYEHSDLDYFYTARINRLILPTATDVNHGYYQYDYPAPNNGINCDDGTALNLNRTINDGTGSYTTAFARSTAGSTTTETSPLSDQSQTVYTFNNVGLETGRAVYQGLASGGQSLVSVATTYAANGSPASRTLTVGTRSARTETDYDSFGNLTELREFDWNNTSSVARKTTLTYLSTAPYVPLNIRNRLTSKIIKDANGNAKARTDISYDDANSMIATVTGTSNHDDSYDTTVTLRGNPTTVKSYTDAVVGTYLSTSLKYDTLGNLRQVIDPNNNTTSYDYTDSWTNGSCAHNPPVTIQAYVTTITNPLNQTAHFKYSSCIEMRSAVIDANQQTTSYGFDYLRRVTAITPPPDGAATNIAYDDTNRTITSTTQNLISTTTFDSLGRVTKELMPDPDGAGTVAVDRAYDQLGRLQSVSNPHRSTPSDTDGQTSYAYDALGRTTQITRQDNTSTALMSYAGAATSLQDEGNGNGTRRVQRISQVDGLGRMVSVCEVSSATLPVGTNQPGNCGLDIAGTGFLTTYQYDTLNNVTGVTQSGQTRSYAYDGLSRLTSENNPESGTTTYQYDGATKGDLYRRFRPYPNQTNPAVTASTTYSYDVLHRLTGMSYQDSTPTPAYVYDSASGFGVSLNNTIGRSAYEGTISGGQYVSGAIFSYDTMGRIKKNWQCQPYAGQSGTCTTSAFMLINYTYDNLGNLLTATNGAGMTFTYSYNSAGRLTGVSSSWPPDANHPATLLSSVSYNALGLPVSATLGNGAVEKRSYDNRGRLKSITSGTAYSWSATYAPNGNVLTVDDTAREPALTASMLTQQGLSPNFYPGSIVDNDVTTSGWSTDSASAGACLIVDFGANNAKAITEARVFAAAAGYAGSYNIDFSNAPLTCDPQSGARAASYFVPSQQGWNSIAWTTAGVGANRYWRLYLTNTPGPGPWLTELQLQVNGNWTYTYDDFNRLLTATQGNSTPSYSTQSYSYDYDPYGNRWHQNLTGGSGLNTLYSFDAYNHIQGSPPCTTANPCYDAAGNMLNDGTHLYTYDSENRISQVDSGSTIRGYGYDAEGRRFIIGYPSLPSQVTLFDLSGRPMSYFDWNSTLTRSEVYAGGRHLATYYNNMTYFPYADNLGTERVRTSASGAAAESFTSLPFGDLMTPSTSGSSPVHFTGQEHDAETNLEHFWFRQYSSNQGRWMSPDPAGQAAVDPANPQTWNRYAYVANNPVNAVDPEGLMMSLWDEWGGGGGGGWGPYDDSGYCSPRYAYCGDDPFGIGITIGGTGGRGGGTGGTTGSGSGPNTGGLPPTGGETNGIPNWFPLPQQNIWGVLLPGGVQCDFGVCVPIASGLLRVPVLTSGPVIFDPGLLSTLAMFSPWFGRQHRISTCEGVGGAPSRFGYCNYFCESGDISGTEHIGFGDIRKGCGPVTNCPRNIQLDETITFVFGIGFASGQKVSNCVP